jgi:predicted esterase
MLNHQSSIALVIAILFLGAGVTLAQPAKPGPQELKLKSTVDGSDQPYGLYMPKDFDPSKKYPLVIMLHGASSNDRLALRRVFGKSNLPGESDAQASSYYPQWKDIDYFVATPYCRGTMGYQGLLEQDVYDVLAEVEKNFPIDPDRVYLTGLSMGGGGSVWIGLTRPDIWAAIAPVCPAIPPAAHDLVINALNYPVHVFQGGADPTVSPALTRAFVQRLKYLGAQIEYAEYPGVGHNSWENAYKDEAIFTWFSQFRRNRFPDRVRYVTRNYKYASVWWVRFNAITPGLLALIDANFTAPNRLEISTLELDALTLNVRGHPKYDETRPLQVTIDGKLLTLQPDEPGSDWPYYLSKQNGAWTTASYQAPPNAKRAGAEGPIYDALSTRHIYVYGTADNPAPDELKKRRDTAQTAANWFTGNDPFGHAKTLILRVLADKDVTEVDINSNNLVLFGAAQTNALIQKFSDRLPLSLNADAKGYGLLYIFPIGQHYVLVNSGLPWWTFPQSVRQPGWNWSGVSAILCSTEMDYVLFRDSWNDVVTDGRFNNTWQLPASAASQLRSTRVITVNPAAAPAGRRGG